MRAPASIRRPPGTTGRNRPTTPPSTRTHPNAKVAMRLNGLVGVPASFSEEHVGGPEHDFVVPSGCCVIATPIHSSADLSEAASSTVLRPFSHLPTTARLGWRSKRASIRPRITMWSSAKKPHSIVHETCPSGNRLCTNFMSLRCRHQKRPQKSPNKQAPCTTHSHRYQSISHCRILQFWFFLTCGLAEDFLTIAHRTAHQFRFNFKREHRRKNERCLSQREGI